MSLSPTGSEPSSSSSILAPWIDSNPCSTFQSLRARRATGTHLLRIQGYSAADRMLQPGQSIESRPFAAGGHQWRLRFFPNGYRESKHPGPAAVELELMDKKRNRSGVDDVVAAYRLSVLGRDGSPAYSYVAGPQRFSDFSKYKHHVGVLVTPEERKAALRLMGDDDTLAVRCDLTVTRFDKESRLKYYLRKMLQE